MSGSLENSENVNYIPSDGKSMIAPAFSTPYKREPEVYFGVFLPDISELPNDQDVEKVYTDKTACLAVMKKYRGSRFKGFGTYEEALEFAENGPVISLSHSICGSDEGRSSNINAEKPSPFRGPKSQDLVKFRKAIEKDDVEYFDQCINENPRYLVSSGDTPAILQEGSRYNALHVACRTNKPNFVSKVLSTISQPEFFQRLYPDDTWESSERRSKYLLDLYLNTPDKGLNETPIHFASKHGSLECVRVLTSYPDCNKNRKNKFSQTPLEIVCTRSKDNSKKLIDDIASLLGDHYYVPLLRDDDLCILPQIGEPWSPKQDIPGLITEEQQLLACLSPGSSDSPLSPITPTLKVRGYAGPMSPTQAEVFHRRWRDSAVLSPTRPAKIRSPSLRLTDQDKGLERIGRDLAATNGYPWNEYWDFLGEFTNVCTDEGLSKLEMYLKQKQKQLMMEQYELDSLNLSEKLQDLKNGNTAAEQSKGDNSSKGLDDTDLSKASQSTMSELCQELEALRLNVSLSPQLDSSGQPIISASSKFLQCWRERVENKGTEKACREMTYQDPTEEYLHYITKSICVSASRLADVLGDLARELQSSTVTNLSVSKAVRTKLRPEILCLKNVVGKCITKNLRAEVDYGFIHIILAFKATEDVQLNLSPADICVLAETLKVVVLNLNFIQVHSSDEEDNGNSEIASEERRNNTNHVSCVLRALEKAMTIAYNNCSSSVSVKDNKNSLRMHLLQLGDCTCCWNSDFEEKYQHTEYQGTPANTQKYNKAFSFVHNTLFSETRKVEINKNEKNLNNIPETIVKQLTFDEDGENVILASLTVGNGKLNKLECFEEKHDDNEDDDNDSFATACSSLEEDLMTPEEGLKVFINGLEASKIDADVLAAIEVSAVDEAKYPYVAAWLHLVRSYSEVQRNSWTTPYHGRGHLNSVPRLSSNNTPSSQRRLWIPSSASRVLFRDQSELHK